MPKLAPPQDAVSVIAQEFKVKESFTLTAEVSGARTRLRPSSEPDRVEITISVSGCPAHRAEDILDRMQVGTRQMKDTIRVYSQCDPSQAEWWRWVRTLDVTVHLDIQIPTHVDAEIRAPGGSIDAADLSGNITLKPMGSPCRAENLQGTLNVRAESSEVSILGFSGERLDARVASGALSVKDVETDTLILHSVAAPMTVTNASGETEITANGTAVDIKSLSGPSTAHIQGGKLTYEAAPTEPIDLTVVGSTLDALLPSDLNADLKLSGGTVFLADSFAFEGDRTDQNVEGQLNKGGPSVKLTAIRGDARCKAS